MAPRNSAIAARSSPPHSSSATATSTPPGKYGSEKGVGEGIRASGVPRREIFLCTKVSHEFLRADDFARKVDESLKTLQVDYVDMLHVHWPSVDKVPLAETMGALAKAKREGKTRHIGVANFNIALLEEAIRTCPEQLATLQAEYHPYLDQSKVLAYCRKQGLIFTAYCPLARGAHVPGSGARRNRAQQRQDHRPGRTALADAAECRRRSRAPPIPSALRRTWTCSTSS